MSGAGEELREGLCLAQMSTTPPCCVFAADLAVDLDATRRRRRRSTSGRPPRRGSGAR